MSAEWQKIGGVEVCEGTDGTVGVSFDGILVFAVARKTGLGWCSKAEFEAAHCQPRHRLIECADGAVMVLYGYRRILLTSWLSWARRAGLLYRDGKAVGK